MKKLRNINLLIIPIAMIITSLMLSLLKDEVPMKFFSDGTVKEFGSKYEFLLFPGIIILVVNILNFLSNGFKDNEKGKNGLYIASIIINGGILALTIGTILNVILVKDHLYIQIDVIQLITILVSTIIFVLALFVLEKNGNNIVCLKNKYSMYNKDSFDKTQNAFGKVLLTSSALLLVCGTLVKGLPLMYLDCAIFVLIYIVSNVASYKCYLSVKKSEENIS